MQFLLQECFRECPGAPSPVVCAFFQQQDVDRLGLHIPKYDFVAGNEALVEVVKGDGAYTILSFYSSAWRQAWRHVCFCLASYLVVITVNILVHLQAWESCVIPPSPLTATPEKRLRMHAY